jgi:hypothetical protein
MTEFAETAMRHRCRNPKCRMKLPTPVSNEREAFCCRGCYQSFHLHRCIVCEGAIERTTANRKICKKSKCRNALAAGLGFGRYHADSAKPGQVSQNLEPMQETAAAQHVSSASKPVERAHRPWRIIAGPPLTPSQFHCATLPGTAMDDVMRIEAKNKAALKTAEEAEIEDGGYFTDTDWREVVSPDGVICYVTRFRVAPTSINAAPPIPDDLSIPAFLRRTPPQAPEQLLAA